MNHWGKLIGAFVGYLMSGIFGAGVGLLLGFFVDKLFVGRRQPRFSKIRSEDLSLIRSEFFDASFLVMGYVARASGSKVNNSAVYAMNVIKRMGLPEDRHETAVTLFNDGASIDFSLHKIISQFYLDCRDQPSLLEMFLEIQLFAVFGDSELSNTEKDIIQNIAYQLDFSAIEFDRIENSIRDEIRHSTHTIKKRRQAEQQWTKKLAQDQNKQRNYRQKQQRTQRRNQEKAYVAQQKEQVAFQKARKRAQQAKLRAQHTHLQQQEKQRRVQEKAQARVHRQQHAGENAYAYESVNSNWSFSGVPTPLEQAYATLNMPHCATNADIKMAYRRLTSKHHPDKLAAKDLPLEIMKDAEVKTREIRAAYDHIKEVRNF